MGAIEDIYADLDTDVSEEKFREAVQQKVEQMEGLADEETAAMIIAHELADSEVETIADIKPAMDDVKFLAKVITVGDVRIFDRDDGEGKVINVEAGDETGRIWLSLWDEQAEAAADGDLEVGDVLRVQGRPREGYKGLEVSVDRVEPEPDVEITVDTGGETIDSLSLGQSDVTVRGLVLEAGSVRTFDRDDGSEGKVANLTLGDETGRVRVTLWDDQADRTDDITAGTAVEVVNGYVRERDGNLEVHVGDHGAVEEIDESVEYDPDATQIADVEIGETVDIAGVVRSTDPVRTFDRDDGSEGQVRNIRVQDATDDIRIALWGEQADIDIAPGDELLAADVEIQEGWQDDLEASAGWQSTLVVLEDASVDVERPGTDDGGQTVERSTAETNTTQTESSTGLDAFADGNNTPPDTESGESEATTDADDRGKTEVVEFTGTVVQTGEPVVLDDGKKTMSVDTDANLRLGEEVTARGELTGDRLDAEEIL